MLELYKLANQLFNSGELRVVYDDMPPNFNGHIMNNNEYTVIVLNSNLSYEHNLIKFAHELSHIKHLKADKDTKECEYEAELIEHNPNALEELKRLDYFYKYN